MAILIVKDADRLLIGRIIIMSNDAISRQEALDEWNRLSERGRTEFDQVLMMLPSAEPEIIHCKDCIHWINKHLCEIWSRYGTIETKPDFYCGFGVRRNNE